MLNMHCIYMSKGFNIFLHISFIHFKIKLMTVLGVLFMEFGGGGALGLEGNARFFALPEITASSERIKFMHTQKFTHAKHSK